MSSRVLAKTVLDTDHLRVIQELARGVCHSVHQHPEWYSAYIQCLRPRVLFILVEDERNMKVVGGLPLQMEEYRGTRFWKLRRLVPLAHGPSDFVNLLVEPGYERVVAREVASYLRLYRNTWEEMFIPYIPADSSSWELLVWELRKSGFVVTLDTKCGFLEIDTSEDWAGYEEGFLRPRNKDLFRDMRWLRRRNLYPKVLHVKNGICRFLPELLEIYRRRRESLGQEFKYQDSRYLSFLYSVIEAYEAFGGVELSCVVGDDHRVWAFQIDWLDQGTRYHWMFAYNEEFRRYSPGKLLLYEVIRKSFIDIGTRRFNFMRGEAPYKKKFAGIRKAYVYIRVVNPLSLRYRATRLASKICGARDLLFGRKS